MAEKAKFDRSKPHVNIGTIGHVDEAVLYDKRLVYIFVCHEFVQLDT